MTTFKFDEMNPIIWDPLMIIVYVCMYFIGHPW